MSNFARPLAIAIVAAFTLAACDRESTEHARRDAVSASQKVSNAIERTGEKLVDASRTAAAEVKEAGRDAKDATVDAAHDVRTSDAAITASIKTDYVKDPDLSALKIDVDTHDGVVTLNGLAPSDAARQRAEKLAAANKGVKEVRNHLTLKQG